MYEDDDYLDDDEEEEEEVEQAEPTADQFPVQQVKEDEPEFEDKLGGRVLNGFSKLFFVLTIIGTILAAIMVFLPIFLAIVGVVSTIVWIFGIIIVSIFTIGLIWTSEDFKAFNSGWMDFNSRMFERTNSLTEFATSMIPFVLVSGTAVIAISWLFTILGAVFDKIRFRRYKSRIIGLSIITVIYIVFLVLNIIIHSQAAQPQ